MEEYGILRAVPVPRAGIKEWIGLAVLTLPVLLVSMDMTIMYLVLPALSTDLKPGSAELLWITDIFGFLEAGLLITMGVLGDRIGRRKLLLIGGTAFALASMLAAFSTTVMMLIFARALLGISGASLLPSTLSIIRNLFHEGRQRTLALGIFTTCFSAGTMLGPVIGGILLSHFGWGSVFLVAAPVMALFLALAPFWLPEFRDPVAGRFDLASAGLSIAAVLLAIYGIKRMAEQGFAFTPMLCLAAGLLLGALFLRRQSQLANPLIDTKLFGIKGFSVTLLAMLVSLVAWAGAYLFITQQLQLVLGMDPYHAGLWTITGAAGGVIGCSTVPIMLRHFNRALLIPAGLLIMVIGLLAVFVAQTNINLAVIVITMVCLSAGCGITVTLGHDVIMATAKPQQAGAAASLAETAATFGGAFGIALLGSLGAAIYRGKMTAMLEQLAPAVVETAKTTLGAAIAVSEKLSGPMHVALVHSAKNAFSHSFSTVAGIGAVLLMVMALIVYRRLSRAKADAEDSWE